MKREQINYKVQIKRTHQFILNKRDILKNLTAGALFIIYCSLFTAHAVQAQPLYWLGGHAGYGGNILSGGLDIVPGSSQCGAFANGSGSGFRGGLLFELPLLDQLRLSARGGFEALGGTFTTQLDNGLYVYQPSSRTIVPLLRQHTYATTLNYGTIDLPVRYAPFDFPLGFLLGPSLALPVFGASYVESEQILSPQGYLYLDGLRTQTDAAGALANTKLRIAAIGGVGYDFPIGPVSFISPEFTVSFPFTQVVAGESWKSISYSAGVAVKIGIMPHVAAPPPPPMPEPGSPPPPAAPVAVTPLPPAPNVSLSVSNAADIHIVATTVTETFPILPYIFFDENSSQIPPRYIRRGGDSIATFHEENLPDNAPDIYHSILDVTGKRMKDDPGTTVIITGTTDGKETEDTTDALARADAVKRYLVSAWGIDGSRIRTQARGLPANPTDEKYPEGDAENRRVEITSLGDNIFSPIVHANFTEYSMTPPLMVFNLGALSQAGAASWSLEAHRNSTPIAAFGGMGAPPKDYTWKLPDSVARILSDTDHISCALTVRDVNGLETTSQRDVPVYKQKNNVEVGRLSLIVFDFDKSDISPENHQMMSTFVAAAVRPASTVAIIGTTDRLGEAEHNQELSESRAQSVKRLLLASKPQANVIECKGIGESQLKYDNALPEGRYYCRTVAITVQTPVGQ